MLVSKFVSQHIYIIPHILDYRPLGNLEVFFKMLTDKFGCLDREHWTVSLAMNLSFPPSIGDPTHYLSRAWQALRLQYPALGATLSSLHASDKGAEPWVSIGPYDAHSWAKDTFILSDEKDASTLFSKGHPTPTATCYWLPSSREVMIRSSHWRIDGVGMVKLGHSFLTILAATLGLDTQAVLDDYMAQPSVNPPVGPSLEALAGQSKGEEDPRLAAAADELVGQFVREIPSIGLPTRTDSKDAQPQSSSRISVKLDAPTTSKVTSAVHAAIVRVTAGFPQHPLSRSYAAFAPLDLRRTIATVLGPEIRNDSMVTGAYFTGLPVCVGSVLDADGRLCKDFQTISREIDNIYSQDFVRFWESKDGSGNVASILDLAEPYVRRTTALFSAPIPEGFPPVQTPDLSSLGKLDAQIRGCYVAKDETKIDVVNCWLGTEMLTRNVQFHIWGWKGEFTLAASFNNSFYEVQFVTVVLNKVIEELLDGCGIEKS
ncbi:hypothetical protein F4819DRAFT_496010 [Hypoxylon fuscum]|nr:hypothetical protein F4819DRAFT_496010 [Hypoxylon fuscum]